MNFIASNRAAFNRDHENGYISNIRVMVKPTGAICFVNTINGISNLHNGTTHLVNDELSSALTQAGITGWVLIHAKDVARVTSKWLTYNLNKLPLSEWADNLVVYTFGQDYDKGIDLPFEIKPLEMEDIDQGISSILDKYSQDLSFDGLLISALNKAKGEVFYKILPNRVVKAKVIAVGTGRGGKIVSFIVECIHDDKKYRVNVSSIPSWIKDTGIYRYRNKFIGAEVDLSYTSFNPGDRLKNFSSPAITSVPAVEL